MQQDRHVKPTKANMQLWTWRGVVTFAAICALSLSAAALVVALVALPEAGVDTTPTESDHPIVPAFGAAGFPAYEFCNDPLTQVSRLIVPDAVGNTYQLVRIRDSSPEALVWPSQLDGPFEDEASASLGSFPGTQPMRGPDGNWYAGPPAGYNQNGVFYYMVLDDNGDEVQRSGAATIDDRAAKCILEKAR